MSAFGGNLRRLRLVNETTMRKRSREKPKLSYNRAAAVVKIRHSSLVPGHVMDGVPIKFGGASSRQFSCRFAITTTECKSVLAP